MIVELQLIILKFGLSFCANISPKPYSLLASTKRWVCSSGSYGLSFRFCAMVSLSRLNFWSSSFVHQPSQCELVCVSSLRCFVLSAILGYQLCRTLMIPRNDWTCVLVLGISMSIIVWILAWSAEIVMLWFAFFSN